jgi:hypothetical protein
VIGAMRTAFGIAGENGEYRYYCPMVMVLCYSITLYMIAQLYKTQMKPQVDPNTKDESEAG